MLGSSVNRPRSHANLSRILTYEIARPQPLCYQHLCKPLVSIHSRTFTDAPSTSQTPCNQHSQKRPASVANVKLVTPLESALTQTYRLSLLQSALTKSDGGPLPQPSPPQARPVSWCHPIPSAIMSALFPRDTTRLM